ncbi:MAG: response regulator [Bdellovibrionales bacterium]|nr:response regulator [Bdellovibrionales bacterium]
MSEQKREQQQSRSAEERTLATVRRSLDAANRELAVRRRQTGLLLRRTSESLRMPVAELLSALDALSPEQHAGGRERAEIDAVRIPARRLLRIAEALECTSGLATGTLSLNPVVFASERFLAELESALVEQLQGSALEVRLQLLRRLPLELRGDLQRMRQMVQCVVDAAAERLTVGAVVVTVSYAPQEQDLIFSISDSGPGLAAEQVYALQEELRQPIDRTVLLGEHATLDLKLAAEIAQALGGRLEMESDEALGSTILCRVQSPAVIATEKMPAVEAHRPPPPTSGLGLEQLSGSMLIVDDQLENQRLAAYLLRKTKVRFTIAENGAEALERASTGQFDVILMDLTMPHMDGSTAAAALRARGFTGPIVAVTAVQRPDELQHWDAARFDAVLEKPFSAGEFYEVVRNQLKAAATTQSHSAASLVTQPSKRADSVLQATVGREDSTLPVESQYQADPAFTEVIEEFRSTLLPSADELKGLSAAGDWKQLAFRANELAGAASMTGFRALSDLLTQLEVRSGAGQAEAVLPLLQEFEHLARRIAKPGILSRSETPRLRPPNRPDSSDLATRPSTSIPSVAAEPVVVSDLINSSSGCLEVVLEFLDSVNDYLTQIERFALDQQWEKVGRVAHEVSGTAALCGYQTFARTAQQLEAQAQHGSDEDAANLLKALMQEAKAMQRGRDALVDR